MWTVNLDPALVGMRLVNIDPDLEPNSSSLCSLTLRDVDYALLKHNSTTTQIGGFMETSYRIYSKVYRLSQDVALMGYRDSLERFLTLCAYVK